MVNDNLCPDPGHPLTIFSRIPVAQNQRQCCTLRPHRSSMRGQKSRAISQPFWNTTLLASDVSRRPSSAHLRVDPFHPACRWFVSCHVAGYPPDAVA